MEIDEVHVTERKLALVVWSKQAPSKHTQSKTICTNLCLSVCLSVCRSRSLPVSVTHAYLTRTHAHLCFQVFDAGEDSVGVLTPKYNLEPPHYDGIQSLCLMGDLLFSGSRDTCVKKWNLAEQKLEQVQHRRGLGGGGVVGAGTWHLSWGER